MSNVSLLDFFAGNPRKGIPALIVSACMNTNPMMIYFGQEFGELGMDSEGLSGRTDGLHIRLLECRQHTTLAQRR